MGYSSPRPPPSVNREDPEQVMSWSTNQVCQWLSDNQFDHLQDTFTSNNIDGSALLTLTADELNNDLHVLSLGERKRMLERITTLRSPQQTKCLNLSFSPQPPTVPSQSPRVNHLRIPTRNIDGSFGSRPNTARPSTSSLTRPQTSSPRHPVRHGSWQSTRPETARRATVRPSTSRGPSDTVSSSTQGAVRPWTAVSERSAASPRVSPFTNRVSYSGRDTDLADKLVLVYGNIFLEDLRAAVKSVGYRTEPCMTSDAVLTALANEPKVHAVVLSFESNTSSQALDVLLAIRSGTFKTKIPVIVVPEDDSSECTDTIASAMHHAPCLLASASADFSALRQTLQVCSMLSSSSGRAVHRTRSSHIPMNSPRSRPCTGLSSRMSQIVSNPISASMSPRYTHKYAKHSNEEMDDETKLRIAEEDRLIDQAPPAVIAGYVGHIPGLHLTTYGRAYDQTVKDGPKRIVPEFRDESERKFYPADTFYPRGCPTKYAKLRKNLRNRAHITLGDNRVNEMLTTSKEFYPKNGGSNSAEMKLIESLTKPDRRRHYRKLSLKIGEKQIDQWEDVMRQKIMMYTSGGQGRLRRMFRFFDRDASGMVDLDEFSASLVNLGMVLDPEQVVAFFGRYDNACTAEIGYGPFIKHLLDDAQINQAVRDKITANIMSSLGIESKGDNNHAQKQLTMEEKHAQKPLIDMWFDELDVDHNGKLDLQEFRALCTKLHINVSDAQLQQLRGSIQHLDRDMCCNHFFEWFCSAS